MQHSHHQLMQCQTLRHTRGGFCAGKLMFGIQACTVQVLIGLLSLLCWVASASAALPAGRYKEACELCANAGQPWRAVSLSGIGPWGPWAQQLCRPQPHLSRRVTCR
jgi:hypothetical protein